MVNKECDKEGVGNSCFRGLRGCGVKFSVYYKNGRERVLICGNSYKKICPYNKPCICRKCSNGKIKEVTAKGGVLSRIKEVWGYLNLFDKVALALICFFLVYILLEGVIW